MDEELAKFPELIKIGREMMNAGRSTEEILTALRAYSPSVIQSIKVMRDLLGIPMDEAKLLVHRSRTWSDMRDVFSEVHEIAEEEYRRVSEEGSDGFVQAKIDLDKKERKR
jgi:ribosomal protein L7/L12